MYRALYRKWRPQRFADVVGQTAIVTALQNQIAAGRIGHAYLFTGTRGTGKANWLHRKQPMTVRKPNTNTRKRTSNAAKVCTRNH